MHRPLARFVALVGTAVLAVGCGGTRFPAATPTGFRPDHSALLPANLLSRHGSLLGGRAQVQVWGGMQGTYFYDLGPPGYFRPAPGELALQWVQAYGDTLTIVGRTPAGTARTSPQLVLQLIQAHDVFESASGECTLTVTPDATRTFVSGQFTCLDLRGGGVSISARGVFSAHR